MKVLTVTLNPSIDIRLDVAALKIGEVNSGTSIRTYGGKGINVAKTLGDLGVKVTATGFLGEYNSKGYAEYFEKNRIKDEFIYVDGHVRINTKIEIGSPRSTTLIKDTGFLVPEGSLKEFVKKYTTLVKSHDLIVLSGSIPSNVSEIIYADLIEIAREKKKKVFLDTEGTPLRLGIKARPHLVKPNLDELSSISDKKLTLEQALEVGKEYITDGIGTMVISMGGKGALWLDAEQQIEAVPPIVPIRTTQGAGDAMLSGLVYGDINGWSPERSMSFSTALAAYTVSRAKIGFNELTRIKDLEDITHVRRIS